MEEDCNCPGDEVQQKRIKTLENPNVRMSYCNLCPKRKINMLVGPTCGTLAIPEYEDGKMTACGCILNIKTKMKNKHCPQGKW